MSQGHFTEADMKAAADALLERRQRQQGQQVEPEQHAESPAVRMRRVLESPAGSPPPRFGTFDRFR